MLERLLTSFARCQGHRSGGSQWTGRSPDAGGSPFDLYVRTPIGSSWRRSLTEMTESTLSTVDSRDGTKIGYWTSGQGPPLVLVHGMTADHTRWAPLLPYLEPKFTVHAIDRRGRGASEDGRDYELKREFEDVAAVVDALAAASGNKWTYMATPLVGCIRLVRRR